MNARDVQEAVTRARDAVSVNRVFGEPYEKNGVTVIPAARIWGGGGGGLQDGQGAKGGTGAGFGSGFGMVGRPAGVFVIRGERVRWQPAVDPTLIVALFLLVSLTVLRAVRRRRRRRMWAAHGPRGQFVRPAGEPVPESPGEPPPAGVAG
ncbi:MAG: spore germination protein GerW family protein [Kineosporiaceae bacterium]